MLTALDQIANQNHLQLVKAVLPYVRPDGQKMLSVCIKMMELQNILQFYARGDYCVSACAVPGEPPQLLDILADIRSYCEPGEQEMIDQCIQLMSAMELYSMFSQQEPSADPETHSAVPESGVPEGTVTERMERYERQFMDQQSGPRQY